VRIRQALGRQRRHVIRLIDSSIAGLYALRRRALPAYLDPAHVVDAPPSRTGPRGYGALWRPSDEKAARRAIFNDPDVESFERSGRDDASRLSAYFGPDETVLDLGCGIGRVARHVAPLCRRLWAVDASETMLMHARRYLAGADNISYARCDDVLIPAMRSDSVDFAYSLLVLQHLEREDAFALLGELRRVVRPGGVAYLTFPNLLSKTYLDSFLAYVRDGEVRNPARARFYTPQEVERVLSAAGFEIRDLDAGTEIAAVCTSP
jgi:ubiquinone/menaquinone biosynthesis C-methylase UbiE